MTGNRTVVRARLRGLVVLTILLGLAHTTAAAQATDPKVDILQVAGALDGTIARYVGGALQQAAAEDVEVVVVQLSTPGTLGVPPAGLVDAVRTSPVPVVVWIGPPGARVTGAGVQLAVAADVLALAPGAVLGGAVPADLGDRATADGRAEVGATLAQLARARGRDSSRFAALATDAAAIVVTPGGSASLSPDAALPPVVDRARVRVFDEDEVIDAGVADVVASTLPALLASLDGMDVARADGTSTRLSVDPATTTVRFNNQGLLGRLLHTVSTPTLAYLLLVGGVLCLLFEWFQPGFGVAGISGSVLAGLGLYGVAVLPTRWWALALLLIGMVLLALDLALARLGPVTAAGGAALAAGSWWLYSGAASLRLAGWLVVLTVLAAVAFFVFVMTTVLRAQGVRARAGMQAVLGDVGVVRSMLNPQGHVFVGGALWRAQTSDDVDQVRTGTRVRVVGAADDTTLLVVPEEQDAQQRRPEVERA